MLVPESPQHCRPLYVTPVLSFAHFKLSLSFRESHFEQLKRRSPSCPPSCPPFASFDGERNSAAWRSQRCPWPHSLRKKSRRRCESRSCAAREPSKLDTTAMELHKLTLRVRNTHPASESCWQKPLMARSEMRRACQSNGQPPARKQDAAELHPVRTKLDQIMAHSALP